MQHQQHDPEAAHDGDHPQAAALRAPPPLCYESELQCRRKHEGYAWQADRVQSGEQTDGSRFRGSTPFHAAGLTGILWLVLTMKPDQPPVMELPPHTEKGSMGWTCVSLAYGHVSKSLTARLHGVEPLSLLPRTQPSATSNVHPILSDLSTIFIDHQWLRERQAWQKLK